MGKDSARPVLRPFGPATAVYILSRRIYEHVEAVFNACITMQVMFQRCPKHNYRRNYRLLSDLTLVAIVHFAVAIH